MDNIHIYFYTCADRTVNISVTHVYIIQSEMNDY